MSKDSLIYIVDGDRRHCDHLHHSLSKTFPDFKFFKLFKYAEAIKAIKSKRPLLVILSLEMEEDEQMSPFEIVKMINKDQLSGHCEIIGHGNRNILEQYSEQIIETELETIPKPLRIPVLVDLIQGVLSRQNLTKVRPFILQAGDHLFREGDPSDSLFVLKSGKMIAYVKKDGKDFVLGEILPGQMVGEMSFIDHVERSASVKTCEESELVELKLGDFQSFLDGQPVWVKFLIETLVNRLRESNKKSLARS